MTSLELWRKRKENSYSNIDTILDETNQANIAVKRVGILGTLY